MRIEVSKALYEGSLDFPEQMKPIGAFTFLRTYSRYLPSLGRREVFKEMIKRSSEYNVNLAIEHLTKNGMYIDKEAYQQEQDLLFRNNYNLRQSLSGRTNWVGGAETGVSSKYPLSNFNCSFSNIETWEDLVEIFYLLLVGTGTGFRCSKEMAANMPPIRKDFTLEHKEFQQLYPIVKEDTTSMYVSGDTATIIAADSKEAWIDALRKFFEVLTKPEYKHVTTIKMNYDYIRPAGARLNTFGGTASGHTPLQEMFDGFYKVLNNQIDPTLEPLQPASEDGFYHVRPIHILDMGNLIGYNVVVGKKTLCPR